MMEKYLTSSRSRVSLYMLMFTVIHYQAKWHIHQHPDSWRLPRQQMERLIQGLKGGELNWFQLQTIPVLSDNSWIFLPLFQNCSFLLSTLLYIWCLHLSWVEKLICELSILWPVNKGYDVVVSALFSLLTARIWSEKIPAWLRQRVSAQTEIHYRSSRTTE